MLMIGAIRLVRQQLVEPGPWLQSWRAANAGDFLVSAR